MIINMMTMETPITIPAMVPGDVPSSFWIVGVGSTQKTEVKNI